jgi:hypothetical protein
MIIQDLVIDAGLEVPFDNRAAETTFAVSSRKCPALLFIAPYGGAMYFSVKMAGDRLVSVEASFEAGLVSAFDLSAVKGSGRVTLGIYYRQTGASMHLEGFFFAGGAARILDIVSITVSLRIGLVSQGSDTYGYGDFSVEVGCSPFSWTLDYRVERTLSGGGTRKRGASLSSGGRDQLGGAEISESQRLFLDPLAWPEFQDAFKKPLEGSL